MENEKARPEYVNSKTAVWWDINGCPVPDGYDPRRVRPSIESALMDLGYLGPITITAVGNLETISPHILRDLASTGILVKHFITSRIFSRIVKEVLLFKFVNEPPATIMLISDKVDSDKAETLVRCQQCTTGFDLLRVDAVASTQISLLYTRAELLWDSLLGQGETGRRVLRKSSGCESSTQEEKNMFVCQSCFVTYPTVETLTAHLSTEQHALQEIQVSQGWIQYTSSDEEPEPEQEPEPKAKAKAKRKAVRTNFKRHGARPSLKHSTKKL